MKYYIAFLLLLLPMFVYSQSERERSYLFLSQIAEDWYASEKTASYVWEKPSYKELDNSLFITDTIKETEVPTIAPPNFNKKDSIEICGKINKYRNLPFPIVRLPHVKAINNQLIATHWERYERAKGWWVYRDKEKKTDIGYKVISMPLFYDNHSKAVVQIGFYCGNLCGGGEVYIFHFDNGKWMQYKSILSWR